MAPELIYNEERDEPDREKPKVVIKVERQKGVWSGNALDAMEAVNGRADAAFDLPD